MLPNNGVTANYLLTNLKHKGGIKMSIFKSKIAVLLGFLGALCLLLGIYMAAMGQTPIIGGYGPFLVLEGIDRLMGLYPFGFGLLFCYEAKCQYEDELELAK